MHIVGLVSILNQFYSESSHLGKSVLLNFRKARRYSMTEVLFHFLAQRSAHRENTCSTYACDAGTDTKSSASGAIIG